MEESSTKLYGYGLCKGNPTTPKQPYKVPYLHFWYLNLLGEYRHHYHFWILPSVFALLQSGFLKTHGW